MGMLDGIGGTGILSGMKYVNIRHELPAIGIRQQYAKGERNASRPLEMHRDLELPRSDIGWTQLKIDIDCYPCRTAYGFLNHTDFAKKYGQQGMQDLAAATSKHTSEAWDMARNGAKEGHNVIAQQAKSRFWSQVVQWHQWTAVDVPDPEFTVTPQQTKGQMNVGHDGYNISPPHGADIAVTPGRAETYIAKEGSIRMWATEGRLDIYA